MRVLLLLLLCTCLATLGAGQHYLPNWESLDTRPLPDWYDTAKLGIFVHWGVFSVPSFNNEWFWYQWKGSKLPVVVDFMKDNYPPDFTYADFASQFKTELFNPIEWAEIFQASGAKYVVLTSKHCEGFTNWPSKYSFNWNSMDVGSKKDLVGMLGDAIRANTTLRFGLYHVLSEWFNPLYLQDKANNFTTNAFFKEKIMPELYELINKYKPELLWSDGVWEGPDSYWNSTEFVAWLYNDSPVKETVVTNDRWGANCMCKHGGYYTCHDRYNPGTLQAHKWENAMTIDSKSWGYRREATLDSYLTIDTLIKTLAETVSCGGNMLMNVGPTKYGKIAPIFEERLRQMGQWLKTNGQAIYDTTPWTHQNDTIDIHTWYTYRQINSSAGNVYAIYTHELTTPSIKLGAPKATTKTEVFLLNANMNVKWTPIASGGIIIDLNSVPVYAITTKWAYVFHLSNLET